MMIAVGSPVVFRDDRDKDEPLMVFGIVEAIDGPRYRVVTSLGAEWTFSIGDITSGRLRVDERKLPENVLQVEKMVSDVKNDGPYFWRNEIDGEIVQYCSVVTDKTPKWCDWHSWATDVGCKLCEKGMFFL